jgi:hypothetical protein
MWNQKVSMQMIFLININVEFKIEYLLVVIIILVVLIDFIVKKRKTKATSEGIITNDTKTPIAESPRKSVVKKGIIISIAIIAIGIAAYFIYNVPATYKYDKVVFNKGLVYLKKE